MATIRRPLDCFPALHTQSFDEARASIGEIFCPHALLPVSTARTLDMRLHHTGLAGASVNYLEYGQDVQVVPNEFPDFYLLQITLAGANELHCGKEAVTSSRGVGTGRFRRASGMSQDSTGYRRIQQVLPNGMAASRPCLRGRMV